MRVSLICAVALFLFSCSTNSKSNDPASAASLHFGSGGGVSGLVSEYVLYENGKMVRLDPVDGEPEEMGKVRKRKVKKAFSSAREMDPCTSGKNYPDNFYFFVKIEESGQTCGWTWGNRNAEEVGADVISLYKDLNSYLPRNN